eukprot:scaffold2406_cov57-Phaeocystis_antarctica.AAC.5
MMNSTHTYNRQGIVGLRPQGWGLRHRSLGTALKRRVGVCRGGGGAARRGAADLRCEVGVLQELDDLRAPPALGVVQR